MYAHNQMLEIPKEEEQEEANVLSQHTSLFNIEQWFLHIGKKNQETDVEDEQNEAP